MALSESKQIKKILDDKNRILVTFRKDAKGDAIASAVSLVLFLEKMGKKADIICDEFDLPANFKFLEKAKDIKSEFTHLQKFSVNIDIKQTGIKELSYDTAADKLRIYITPKKGFFTKNHITTAQSEFKYDLVFVVASQDLASLGSIYENNTEMFFKTPIINIDNTHSNEQFGEINIIDLTKCSTSEILFGLFSKMGEEHIDDSIATALLTGMISNTKSFKSEKVKPHSLSCAGKLIALGADRDFIIQNLYRTRSISTLKLWGRALQHLHTDNAIGLVWTTITREDFTRSGAEEHDLYDIIDELISTSPEAKITLLLHEHAMKNDQCMIHGILKTEHIYNAQELVKKFDPIGDANTAGFIIKGKSLQEAKDIVVDSIKKEIENLI